MNHILSFPGHASGGGGPRAPWRDPAPDPSRSTLSEAWAVASADAGVMAFVLATLARPGPVIWVQDRLSAREGGVPYARSLRREPIHVHAGRVADALQAMEASLRCPAVAGVVGEIWGEAPRLDFTATKRLAMRAERAGVPCWIIRRGARPGLSAARTRWRVASLPSQADPWDDRAPGPPRWRVELFRARDGRTGTWIATDDGVGGEDAPHRLRLVPASGDGPLGRPIRPVRPDRVAG